MPSKPRLLVFDLDGTLIDSSLDLCNSVNATLAAVGKAPLPHPTIAGYIGDGAAMLVRRALGDPGDLDSPAGFAAEGESLFGRAFGFFVRHYHDHLLDNTHLYPGVMDALTAIRQRNPTLPMAVLTNKPVAPSRRICDGLHIARFFFQNYGGNSFITKKPDPQGLQTIIAEASALIDDAIAPADVVLIGDSDIDALTARRCGARSLFCTYGLAPHTLAQAQPDYTADHPSNWPAALGL
jgi:phosphoglycolate phosphatase